MSGLFYDAMKTYQGVEVHQMEVSGQLHVPADLPFPPPVKNHWIGGWVEPRDGHNTAEKRKPFHHYESNAGGEVSSLSLY
jgi:hypothetical protein